MFPLGYIIFVQDNFVGYEQATPKRLLCYLIDVIFLHLFPENLSANA